MVPKAPPLHLMKINRLLISLAATFAVSVGSFAHDNAAAHSDVAVSVMEMLNVRGGDAAAKRTALEAAIARNLLRAEGTPLPSAELDAPAWFGKPPTQPGANRPPAALPWVWSARRSGGSRRAGPMVSQTNSAHPTPPGELEAPPHEGGCAQSRPRVPSAGRLHHRPAHSASPSRRPPHPSAPRRYRGRSC